MNRRLSAMMDRQRERDYQRELSLSAAVDARTTPRPGDRPTVEGIRNASEAHSKLMRAISTCRALLRGDPITVRIDDRDLDRLGGEFRALRMICFRIALADLNYWYSLARARVQIDHLDSEVQDLRLAITETLDDSNQ